jgi:hypothetical protein
VYFQRYLFFYIMPFFLKSNVSKCKFAKSCWNNLSEEKDYECYFGKIRFLRTFQMEKDVKVLFLKLHQLIYNFINFSGNFYSICLYSWQISCKSLIQTKSCNKLCKLLRYENSQTCLQRPSRTNIVPTVTDRWSLFRGSYIEALNT